LEKPNQQENQYDMVRAMRIGGVLAAELCRAFQILLQSSF
jgi:hypothetical protein